jgi:cyclic pyranopterin phosphate synthase|tara:strand:+ start:97 stop:570 length:474 start_codon:yes stop_codon:yes gene_type:complete
MSNFTHINSNNQPEMVDVGAKKTTLRTAHARCKLKLPPEVACQINDNEIQTKKGPVFHTAMIAGTMATKKTPELIPLCHTIPLNSAKFKIHSEGNEVIIDCVVKAEHKTGVEMEAMTGATVAALTIYDMCKAFSKAITIQTVELIEKTGGKSDYILS